VPAPPATARARGPREAEAQSYHARREAEARQDESSEGPPFQTQLGCRGRLRASTGMPAAVASVPPVSSRLHPRPVGVLSTIT